MVGAAADPGRGVSSCTGCTTALTKDARKNDDVDNKRRKETRGSSIGSIPAAALFVKEGAAQMDSDSPFPAAGPSALHRYTIIGMASK
jgi:hypothetical protein